MNSYLIYSPQGKVIAQITHPAPNVGILAQDLDGSFVKLKLKGGREVRGFRVESDSYLRRLGATIYIDAGGHIAPGSI